MTSGVFDDQIRNIEEVTVKINEKGEVVDRVSIPVKVYTQRLMRQGYLELVSIPSGTYTMGSRPGEGYDDEKPAHFVRILPFWMGQYTVTQEQWHEVMRNDMPYRTRGDHNPVDRVSWIAAEQFCDQLAQQTGKPYRLPSEAEWEYACRAGTATPFSIGPTLTTDWANYVGAYRYRQEQIGVYRHESTPVGSFPPNAFGLYDMHGNVWEWCADTYQPNYEGAPQDGSAWVERKASLRVLRGGGWHEPPQNCRSATRLGQKPSEAEDFFGFRIALSD